MFIKIYDYQQREQKIDVGKLDEIAFMVIITVTGDEILLVQKKNDYILEQYDANDLTDDRRSQDYYDGSETIYYPGIPKGEGIFMDDGTFDPIRVEEGQC